MREPDLNGPRFRRHTHGTLNKAFLARLREAVPATCRFTDDELKSIITRFNHELWQLVIANRDGVELPDKLGHIFIGSCPPKKKPNIDYVQSIKLGKMVQHQNHETDGRLAKIFYRTKQQEYHFKHHELWAFDPTREFSRTVGKAYPKNWQRYVTIDPNVPVRKFFKKPPVTVTPDVYDELAL